jgi:TPR repeat protein
MKVLALVPFLVLSLLAVSCHDRRPVAPRAPSPAPVCEKRTASSCLTLARELEEQGNSRYLEAYEAACALKSAPACERVLADVELTVLPSPTPAQVETWTHRLAQLCSAGLSRACVFRDLLTFSETPLDAAAMKKAYFRIQEACRAAGKEGTDCVYLMQALQIVSRKNSAFFKANALTGYQTACLGGLGEACMHDALLQRSKRDLEWTLSYLLKACELGETTGCDQLAADARRAVLDGQPRWNRSAGVLKTACFSVESRAACLLYAEGHVRGWWEKSDPEAGHAENLRQCRLGADDACLAFAGRLLAKSPDPQAWAEQILRQSCSENHRESCVRLAMHLRQASSSAAAGADRPAIDLLRMACYGPGGPQPQYYSEYDYQRTSSQSAYRNPACGLLGRYVIEGVGMEANEPVGFRLLSQGCSDLPDPVCLFLGEHLRAKGQVNASGIIPVYERICLAGHEAGCFALADLHKTGYKELKPGEAQAKKYRTIGCRLEPAHPICKSGN